MTVGADDDDALTLQTDVAHSHEKKTMKPVVTNKTGLNKKASRWKKGAAVVRFPITFNSHHNKLAKNVRDSVPHNSYVP